MQYIRRRQEWKLNLISASLNDTKGGQAVGVKDMLEVGHSTNGWTYGTVLLTDLS